MINQNNLKISEKNVDISDAETPMNRSDFSTRMNLTFLKQSFMFHPTK